MERLGDSLAESEYNWIVQCLLENTGYTIEVESKCSLTKSDLRNAREKIAESELFADRVIIPREYVLKFRKENQIWEAYKILNGYLPEEQRGRYFWGWIKGFNMYSARFLSNSTATFLRNLEF